MGDGRVELSHRDWTRQLDDSEDMELEAVRMMVATALDVSSPAARQLRGVDAAAAPVCVLHDMFSPWAQEVADRLGVAKHLLYVSSAATLSLGLQVHMASDFPSLPSITNWPLKRS